MNRFAAEVPVVIVGGGPAGLSASLLLSQRGVDSLLLERQVGISSHPKAHVINTRTMEIFRRMGGLDTPVREAAIDFEATRHVRWVRSLVGEEYGHLDRDRSQLDVSPTRAASCAQDLVEKVLLEATASQRGRIVFGQEVVSLSQADDGVVLGCRDTRADSEEEAVSRVKARYVIAADGPGSTVRRLLNVSMQGTARLATMVGIYFHADLAYIVARRPAILYWIMNSASPGTFIALDGRHRWAFHMGLRPGAPDPTLEEAAALVQAGIGEEVPIDVRSVQTWRMSSQIADSYCRGRVFLAGDAAHLFPPTGGLGLNTAVQDVHNLVWKMAMVLAGDASAELLETYETERRPVALRNGQFSRKNFLEGGTAIGPGARPTIAAIERGGEDLAVVLQRLQHDIHARRAHFGSLVVDLGFHYESGALLQDGTAPCKGAEVDGEEVYNQNTRPGSRAPHLWLEQPDGGLRSTIDLWGSHFSLLHHGQSQKWNDFADLLRQRLGNAARTGGRSEERDQCNVYATMELKVLELSPKGGASSVYHNASGVTGGECGSADGVLGLPVGGAILVRPDGHVVWRCRGASTDVSADELCAALGAVLFDRLGR